LGADPPVGDAQALPVAKLRGRRAECGVLDRLADDVRAGERRTLVIHGEPGIGKTVLLEHLARRVPDGQVLRSAGVQSEQDLAFGALHHVCQPMLGRMEALPAPQREALQITFGIRQGPPPDRFLIGLAILGLLSQAAERPLVCLIDDAYWLDRASAQLFTFVARRLPAGPVGMVFATRSLDGDLTRLPSLGLQGLREADARALLESVPTGPLDARIRDQIIAEAGGNPRVLLESVEGLSPAELAGGFGFSGAMPPWIDGAASLEASFQHQCRHLPAESRRLVLLAACEPTGDPVVIWLAAGRSGIGTAAAGPAVEAGLLEFGARVRFTDPLLRSAAYWSASAQDRREAHHVLAEATDPLLHSAERAWHRGQSAAGSDEDIAGELERSATQAQARGEPAVAAAFLQRAAQLTGDNARLAGRALAAAQAKIQAGAPGTALDLLAVAESGQLTGPERARAQLVRSQAAFAANRAGAAPLQLLRAAEGLAAVDASLCRAAYLEALLAACYAGRFASPGASVQEVARAARSAPSAPGTPGAADLLLDGLAILFGQGYAAGIPLVREALQAIEVALPGERGVRWLSLAHGVAAYLWDDARCDLIADRCARLARESGAVGDLPLALAPRLSMLFCTGDLAAAEELIQQLEAAREAMGGTGRLFGVRHLAALRGTDPEASAQIEAAAAEASRNGDGFGISAAQWSGAVLNNGLGRYREALVAAQAINGIPVEPGFTNWALAEEIEAAARAGMPAAAAGAYRRLAEMTSASGTDWALGIQARSAALLSVGDVADRRYREAIERLGRTRVRAELARAHLLYGEWLLAEQQAGDARSQLRTALGMLENMGMRGFAERARRGLRAAGESIGERTARTRAELSAQEAEIAGLAQQGLSNPEIAARLFISARTVQYHLRKVFTKLGISSRGQLHLVMSSLWRRRSR
jgi:DNA-binding CsgD family transcriptional regulator